MHIHVCQKHFYKKNLQKKGILRKYTANYVSLLGTFSTFAKLLGIGNFLNVPVTKFLWQWHANLTPNCWGTPRSKENRFFTPKKSYMHKWRRRTVQTAHNCIDKKSTSLAHFDFISFSLSFLFIYCTLNMKLQPGEHYHSLIYHKDCNDRETASIAWSKIQKIQKYEY